MNRRPLAIAVAIVGSVVILLVILLVTGGGAGDSGGPDTDGDAIVDQGPSAPTRPAAADIQEAGVAGDDGELTFTARMGADVPALEDGSLEWRWEIEEGGQQTWLLTGNVALDPTAHLIATQKDYSSSTIDETLPGDIAIDGDLVTVTLRVDELDGFPTIFRWRLLTTLDASRSQARSATAHDQAPDEGSYEFSGG